jgi:hypothetical protein
MSPTSRSFLNRPCSCASAPSRLGRGCPRCSDAADTPTTWWFGQPQQLRRRVWD